MKPRAALLLPKVSDEEIPGPLGIWVPLKHLCMILGVISAAVHYRTPFLSSVYRCPSGAIAISHHEKVSRRNCSFVDVY